MQIFWQQLPTPLSQKLKSFYRLLVEYLKCSLNLEHSEKKEEYHSLIISEIMHPKEMFTEASKWSSFSTPFGNQRANGFETLLKSAQHHYFPIFPWIRDKLSWKMSALVTFEIFRLFVNTLTPDDKYSRHHTQIFWQQLQTPLSQKELAFFRFFTAFWNAYET